MTAQITNVVKMDGRLRDGRAIVTEKDHKQWVYEVLEQFSQYLGGDVPYVPKDVFPIFIRVMVEWVDGIRGCNNDLEMAHTLADAANALLACMKRCLEGEVKIAVEQAEAKRAAEFAARRDPGTGVLEELK